MECLHLKRFIEENDVEPFRILHAFYVSLLHQDSRKRKAKDCYCYDCSLKSHARIHACLSCVYFGCFVKKHIQSHSFERRHSLAIDVELGNVFCFECNDYQYDLRLEAIASKHRIIQHLNMEGNICDLELSSDEIRRLAKYKSLGFRLSQDPLLGSRGIVDLGSTCYLNVVLQVLIHTPALRDYFLSGKYVCKKDNCTDCMPCEMSSAIKEFFSGSIEPYVPSNILYYIKKNNEYLSYHHHHDAHEVLFLLLNSMHSESKCVDMEHSNSCGNLEYGSSCGCIIEQLFIGSLQNKIQCLDCGTDSVKVENLTFIPLGSRLHAEKCNSGAGLGPRKSLYDCLQMFTHCERLDYKQECQSCFSVNATQETSLLKLPTVLNFIKAVSHSQTKNTYEHINFPEFLDMTPYVPTKTNGSEVYNKYFLYAVIKYISGSYPDGHYVVYLRHNNTKWVLCDNEEITFVNFETVLKVDAYLLFYHRMCYAEPVYKSLFLNGEDNTSDASS